MPDKLMADPTQAASATLKYMRSLAKTADGAFAPVIATGSVEVGIAVGRVGAPAFVTKQLLESRDIPGLGASDSPHESKAVSMHGMPTVSTRAQTACARQENPGFSTPTSGSDPLDAPLLIRVAMADALANGALAPVVGDVDRSEQGVPEEVNRAFRAPRDFDERDPYDDEPVTLFTLRLAPLFERRVLDVPSDHIARYADNRRSLPDCIHFKCLRSWCWRVDFSARDDDIVRHRDRLPSSICQDFVAACDDGLRRMF